MRFIELPQECKSCKKCIPISVDSEGTEYICSEHMDTEKIGDNCIAKYMFDRVTIWSDCGSKHQR